MHSLFRTISSECHWWCPLWPTKSFPLVDFASIDMLPPCLCLALWLELPKHCRKGGQYIVGGVFVDAFWAGTEDEAVQEFIKSYEETIGRNANICALSYDVIQMAAVALRGQQPDSTATVRKNLG